MGKYVHIEPLKNRMQTEKHFKIQNKSYLIFLHFS